MIVISLWRVPESRDDAANRRLDWQGATLVTFGLGSITYALINCSAATSGSEAAIGILGAAGVAALVCFLIVESRSPAPMVSLHMFLSLIHISTISGRAILPSKAQGAEAPED